MSFSNPYSYFLRDLSFSKALEICDSMTLSKLERYLSILETLVSWPLEFENIMYQIDENSNALKKYLDFLISNNLIEKLSIDEKIVVYTITDKGLSLLSIMQGQEYFDEHQNLIISCEE